MKKWSVINILFLVMSWGIVLRAVRLDPFSLPRCRGKKSLIQPTLKGIVRHEQRCGALLALGKKTEIVFTGDTFAGHTVVNVDQQQVCLTRGVDQLTLTLEEK